MIEMTGAALEPFRAYLQSLPEELLEQVTADYVWLSRMDFGCGQNTEFRRRLNCCREECLRRGRPQLYGSALCSVQAA